MSLERKVDDSAGDLSHGQRAAGCFLAVGTLGLGFALAVDAALKLTTQEPTTTSITEGTQNNQ